MALNRAVAVAEVEGVESALAAVEPLREPLARFYLLHGVRAGLLARAGRRVEAAAEYEAAAGLCAGEAEREFLMRRRGELAV